MILSYLFAYNCSIFTEYFCGHKVWITLDVVFPTILPFDMCTEFENGYTCMMCN